jgi:hypothetical protein
MHSPYDLYREMLYRRALETPGGAAASAPVAIRWQTSPALAMLAWSPLLIAFSIVVVRNGTARAVRRGKSLRWTAGRARYPIANPREVRLAEAHSQDGSSTTAS